MKNAKSKSKSTTTTIMAAAAMASSTSTLASTSTSASTSASICSCCAGAIKKSLHTFRAGGFGATNAPVVVCGLSMVIDCLVSCVRLQREGGGRGEREWERSQCVSSKPKCKARRKLLRHFQSPPAPAPTPVEM